MKKPEDAEVRLSSGLFRGSEPLDDIRDRRAAGKDDDKGDDDATDSDKSETDSTDKGDKGDDSRDLDGKD